METWSNKDLAEYVEEVEAKLRSMCTAIQRGDGKHQLRDMSLNKLYVDFLNLS